MAGTVREVMSSDVATVEASAPLVEAARVMEQRDIGDVVVLDDGKGLCGILTDRDIVIRGIAHGRDPQTTRIADVCSRDLVTVSPDAPQEEAVRLMRERALRRVVVTEGDRPVGVVSIGDLAIERDPRSALADISAAPANE